jgi:hypothetical protein
VDCYHAPNRELLGSGCPPYKHRGFHHEGAQGVQFTISEAARREVLGRMLELHHQRYAEEVAAGLHEKAKGLAGTKTAAKT